MFKRLLKISLLGLFLFYYSGSVMFYHSHLIDGFWIVHSHPFPLSKTAEGHTHTQAELVTISILSHAVFLLAAGMASLAGVKILLAVCCTVWQKFTFQNKTLLVKSLRAPPHFIEKRI